MLSNLLIKSNIIESCSNRSLSKLSAIDLYSVGERTRRYFFDERIRHSGKESLPTSKQNQEWDARLSWGDRTISLGDEGRNTWVNKMTYQVKENWQEIRQDMNIEIGIELLWIIMKSRELQQDKVLNEIEKEIRSYLSNNGYDQNAQDARIASLD